MGGEQFSFQNTVAWIDVTTETAGYEPRSPAWVPGPVAVSLCISPLGQPRGFLFERGFDVAQEDQHFGFAGEEDAP